ARDHPWHGGTRGVHRGGHAARDLLDQRHPAMKRLYRDERGFTLIELLVVIIVLGLLVGLVGPELIGAGLDQYRLDVGAYPNTSQGLDSLQRSPGVTNWNGPYLKKSAPKDPW